MPRLPSVESNVALVEALERGHKTKLREGNSAQF